MLKKIFSIALFAIAFLLSQSYVNVPEGFYLVSRVVDGDTISIDINGETKKARLIGVDTPETVHPTKLVECFGKEASQKNKEILEGKAVKIEYDESQEITDKYDRTLVYVFLEDGTNFNEYLIRNGYAYEYTYNEPYKYQQIFKEAEIDAKENLRGLWANGVCNDTK